MGAGGTYFRFRTPRCHRKKTLKLYRVPIHFRVSGTVVFTFALVGVTSDCLCVFVDKKEGEEDESGDESEDEDSGDDDDEMEIDV